MNGASRAARSNDKIGGASSNRQEGPDGNGQGGGPAGERAVGVGDSDRVVTAVRPIRAREGEKVVGRVSDHNTIKLPLVTNRIDPTGQHHEIGRASCRERV